MPLRSTAQRKRDLLEFLANEKDAWLATASTDGEPWLIPLAFAWDGSRLIFATFERSKTTRNLRNNGRARVSLPSTREVVIIDGAIEIIPIDGDTGIAETFAKQCNWDPRRETNTFIYFTLTPSRIQHWRNEPELEGRDVMIAGVWQDDVATDSRSS